MRLFLSSEGPHPQTLEKLQEYTQGLAGKKIVHIPTGVNGEKWGLWKESNSTEVLNGLNAEIDFLELENTTPSELIKRTKNIDILWMRGGMGGYLLYWIRRRELDKLLPELFQRDVLYVGSSSGSMICAKTQQVAEWYIDEEEPGASLIPGLGLIDFEIYPHYREELLPEIKKRHQHGQLYLIKDGEVIIVEDENIKVLGETRILTK